MRSLIKLATNDIIGMAKGLARYISVCYFDCVNKIIQKQQKAFRKYTCSKIGAPLIIFKQLNSSFATFYIYIHERIFQAFSRTRLFVLVRLSICLSKKE